MSKSSYQIIVVGGGLVGKSAALALSQIGLRVALFASPTITTNSKAIFDSRVYALSASSQALFESLRIWQAFDKEKLMAVTDMKIFGESVANIHFSAFQAAVPQLAWIIESRLIEQSLDTALRFQPNIEWFDANIQSIQSLAISDDCAQLILENGEQLNAELVLGADGAHSWVRQQMGITVDKKDYQQTAIVANFKTEKPHGETAFQWFSKGEIIALLPLPNQHVSLVWSAEKNHAEKLLALNNNDLAKEVENITQFEVGKLECISSAMSFPLSLQRVERLIASRVALIGDAAHVIHPLAGQGVNLGLRDVAVLKDILLSKESFRECGDPILLRRYERSRRSDIAALTFVTDRLQQLFSQSHPLIETIRHFGMSALSRQTFLKRLLISRAVN